MQEVAPRIWVGGEKDCPIAEALGWTVIHACKEPCWKTSVGGRKLELGHPFFHAKVGEKSLYLNLVDSPNPNFPKPLFREFFHFAIAHYMAGETLLIHCNLGASRSPALALTLLAKYLRIWGEEVSFEDALRRFSMIYPCHLNYGIHDFLRESWDKISLPPLSS